MKMTSTSILFSIVLLTGLTACFSTSTPSTPQVAFSSKKVGFSINSVARVDNAASLGINTAIVYGTAFTPSDPVGAEMRAKGMHEVDAGLASELFYYECHRTHTVAPPPAGKTNTYCATDENPSIDSQNALLTAIDVKLKADAANVLVIGYWVLDDWPLWDSGSAKQVLQDIHHHILSYTPSYPAICGFGLTLDKPDVSDWNPRIAQNYSNGGCSMVGIYAYVSTYPSYTDGSQFDFTMQPGLTAALTSLLQQGWNIHTTPLLGIGQAFAGPYNTTRYEPGITVVQMQTQATAFCNSGASSIGWYGWDDSGFDTRTLQPMSSTVIQHGIQHDIASCKQIWAKQ